MGRSGRGFNDRERQEADYFLQALGYFSGRRSTSRPGQRGYGSQWQGRVGAARPSASALGAPATPAATSRSYAFELYGAEAQEVAENSAPEAILGTDERIFVASTTPVPFRFIVALRRPDGSAHGTGTLISNCHVLTAGHVVIPRMSATRVAGLVAFPGRNGRTLPTGLGQANVRTMRPSPQWQAGDPTSAFGRPSSFDYALLTLDTPLGTTEPAALGGSKLGFWGHPQLGHGTHLRALDTDTLRGENIRINISGYPGDKCLDQPPVGSLTAAARTACPTADFGSTQWRMAGRVGQVGPAGFPGLITYDMDTFAGHSGSPVWLRWQESRNLVAVHTGEFPVPGGATATTATANRGTRITEDILAQLRTWMRADGVTPTF